MFGAWFGGLLAQNRLKAGWNTDKTRKLTITLGCLIMLPALLAMANPGEPVIAVLIMAVILFGSVDYRVVSRYKYSYSRSFMSWVKDATRPVKHSINMLL